MVFRQLWSGFVSSNVALMVQMYCWTTLFTEHIGGPTLVSMCIVNICTGGKGIYSSVIILFSLVLWAIYDSHIVWKW